MSRFEGYVKLLKNIITITIFYRLQLNFYRLVSNFTNYPNNFGGYVPHPHTRPVATALALTLIFNILACVSAPFLHLGPSH